MSAQYPSMPAQQRQPGGPVDPGQPYNVQPPPIQPPKRRHRWIPWVAYPATLVVGIAIGMSTGDSTPAAKSPQPTVTVTQSAPAASTPAKAATTKPTPAATKPATPTWVTLATLTGSADKKSDTITTHGGKVRLTYRFKGDGVGAIYFLDEGTDLQKDGGIPEVMVTEPGSDSILLRKEAGEYYVSVSTTMRFTVTVAEQR